MSDTKYMVKQTILFSDGSETVIEYEKGQTPELDASHNEPEAAVVEEEVKVEVAEVETPVEEAVEKPSE